MRNPMNFNLWLGICAVCAILGFSGLCFYYVTYRKTKHLSPAVLFSVYWALVAAALLILAIWDGEIDPWKVSVQALLAGLAGAGAGWLLGMYISPIGTDEATAFKKYGTALAGVLSGYTLKTAIDAASRHRPFLHSHWLQIALFGVSLLITMAAVYNSRAYDNMRIEVHTSNPKPTIADGAIQLAQNAKEQFYAEVIGPSNPAVLWTVLPVDPSHPLGKDCGINFLGHFEAGQQPGHYRVIATNLEDPSLSNFARVDVT